MAPTNIEPRLVTSPICGTSDIKDAHSRGFDPLGEGRDTMFVVRQGDQYFGWRNACPHYEHARMAWKKDEFLTGDKSRIICGAHGAQFDIQTGQCTIGPCLGQRLTPVALRIEGELIYIEGPYAPGRRQRVGQHSE